MTGFRTYYESFLNYTLIPSVFALMGIMFADGLGWWKPPQAIFYGLMVHYLGGVLYSMAQQSQSGAVDDA